MPQEFEATYFKRDGKYWGMVHTADAMVSASGATLKEAKEKLKLALMRELEQAPKNRIKGKSHITESIRL